MIISDFKFTLSSTQNRLPGFVTFENSLKMVEIKHKWYSDISVCSRFNVMMAFCKHLCTLGFWTQCSAWFLMLFRFKIYMKMSSEGSNEILWGQGASASFCWCSAMCHLTSCCWLLVSWGCVQSVSGIAYWPCALCDLLQRKSACQILPDCLKEWHRSSKV